MTPRHPSWTPPMTMMATITEGYPRQTCDTQWRNGKTREAVDGKIHEAVIAPARRTGDAGLTDILHADLAEADPREKSFHEAVPFGQSKQRIDDTPVQQAKIAG